MKMRHPELLRENKRLRRMIELIGSKERIVSDEKKKSVRGRELLVDFSRKKPDLLLP